MYRETPVPAGTPGFERRKCKRRLTVTGLGEVVLQTSDMAEHESRVLAGTVNLSDLYDRVELAYTEDDYDDPDHPIHLYCEAALQHDLYDRVTDPDERKLVVSVWKLQQEDNDRWRVYGGIDDGRPWAFLVTELCHWQDDEAFWAEVVRVTEELHGIVRTVSEDEHMDKYAPPQGKPGERVLDETFEHLGKSVNWVVGPDHGRLERQVELIWPVHGFMLDELRARRVALAAALDALWDKAGVGVI